MTQQQTHQQGIEVPSQALPSDGMSRFVRMGAWAAMVSGMALVVSMLLAWLVVPYERLGLTEAYLTSSYSVSSGLRLLGFVLLVWGLIGIYGPQSRAAGTFGLWTFVFVFLGTALAVGNVWAEVFVYPTLAQIAPDMLSGAGFGTEAAAYMARGLTLSYPLFFLGLILFAAATFWAACLSALDRGIVDHLDPGDDVPRSYGGNVPGVDRTGVVGFCGGGLWVLRLEERTLNHLVLRI